MAGDTMTQSSTEIETPGDEEALANFMYSIRSYDEAEAKAKLLWPALRAYQPAATKASTRTPEWLAGQKRIHDRERPDHAVKEMHKGGEP